MFCSHRSYCLRTLLTALCLVLGAASAAHAQTLLLTLNGKAPGDQFGSRDNPLVAAGDVNADGVPDIIVGAFGADPGGLIDAGQATVFSGADGSVIHTFNGSASGDGFGRGVASVGDVNGDGVPDIAVARDPTTVLPGQTKVFSGRSGALIYTLTGPPKNLGVWVTSRLGDVNGDGVPDIAVGGPCPQGGGDLARIFSGANGALLRQFTGGTCFGSVANVGLGDVNGDGLADVLIGAWLDGGTGRAFVYSGLDGSVIHQFHGTFSVDRFGFKKPQVWVTWTVTACLISRWGHLRQTLPGCGTPAR